MNLLILAGIGAFIAVIFLFMMPEKIKFICASFFSFMSILAIVEGFIYVQFNC